jgi:competence protein ComEA
MSKRNEWSAVSEENDVRQDHDESQPVLRNALRIRVNETLDDIRAMKRRVVVSLILVVAGVAAFAFAHFANATPKADSFEASSSYDSGSSHESSTQFASTSTTAANQLVVYAVGAVKSPGLYTLSAGSRVGDVINAAGGLTDAADSTRLNLAAKVTDGQRIYVVSKGEAAPADASGTDDSTSGDANSAPVNINDASQAELQNLPGVGPSTAAAIVQYRTQHGSFASVDDLDKVKGIGPSKLAQIKPDATV